MGKSKNHQKLRKSKLENLLKMTPEACYWCGFLLADGSNVNGRISLGLANKDREHLEKYANFIEYTGSKDIRECTNSTRVASMNKKIAKILEKRYGICRRKTYNPPNNLPDISDGLMLSFIIGFIDGDGRIMRLYKRPDFQISIRLHSSWLGYLSKIRKYLENIYKCSIPKTRIQKDGYAFLCISNSTICKKLKKSSQDLNLPVLRRKWNNINLNYVSYQELGKIRVLKTKEMLKQGKRPKEISQRLGISIPGVLNLIKRNELGYLYTKRWG